MNLSLARSFGRARFRVLDFEVSGCAQTLQRELERAAAYAPREALAALEDAYRECEAVVGALTLVYLLGSLLRHCAANRRMDDDDPLTATYRKLIETRSAWMPA